jgi:predicted RNase H-like nuclease (RuvC/YqgF family)|tara:strand:+ start:175 stop:426 length:252 start_codon:yes stop_codon:yes gene_type:complete
MDEAGRFTAEHSVMEAGIEIRELKHKLELAENKIQKLELEIAELKNNGFDRDLLKLDIGKSVKEQPELRSVMSEKYNKFGEDA